MRSEWHWFVRCDLQIFSGCVCHLEQLHAQSPFLFPIVFSINLSLGSETCIFSAAFCHLPVTIVAAKLDHDATCWNHQCDESDALRSWQMQRYPQQQWWNTPKLSYIFTHACMHTHTHTHRYFDCFTWVEERPTSRTERGTSKAWSVSRCHRPLRAKIVDQVAEVLTQSYLLSRCAWCMYHHMLPVQIKLHLTDINIA